jgi:hypothetical protein
MKNQSWRIIFSILLILLGVAALLANFNLLPVEIDMNASILAVLFAIVALGFLAAFFTGIRENWWAVIPAMPLLGVAMLIGLPVFRGSLGGAMFLAMIGLAFWIIYIISPRERWWAIIPGGVLATLALTVVVSDYDRSGIVDAGVFFIGLALTFGLVYLATRQSWALWPAGALAVVGSLVMLGSEGVAGAVFPALLIVLGALLVFRSLRRGGSPG